MRYFVLLLGLTLLPLAHAEEEIKSATVEMTAVEPPREEPKLGLFTWLTDIPGAYASVGRTLFSKETLTPFLYVVGSTAVLIKYDYEAYRPFNDEYKKQKLFFRLSNFGWDLGKGSAQFALAGMFLAYGWAGDNYRALRTGSQILEVVIATGITTQTLKHITGRESPCVALPPHRTGKWQFFTNPRIYHKRVSAHDAYPSGHIATTFATARVIELNYPEQTWVPYVAYPIIAFIGTSMVATAGHWWSDYPLSLLLGYHFGKAVTRNNAPQKAEDAEKKLSVDLWSPMKDSVGVMLSKRF